MKPEIERELEKALRRTEPAPDFADRVMARLAAQTPVTHEHPSTARSKRSVDERREAEKWWQRLAELMPLSPLTQWQSRQWMAAGTMACLLVAGTFGVQRYRAQQRMQAALFAAEQAEGERAKEQVMLALQIASAKLNVAQRKVKESTERAD